MRALGLVVAVVALGACGGRSALELPREPYVGVRCRVPNTVSCDRIGVAVWLSGDARSVAATLAGRTIELAPPADGADYWVGDIRGAGLVSGDVAVRTTVPVRVVADGRAVTVRVRIHEGWG